MIITGMAANDQDNNDDDDNELCIAYEEYCNYNHDGTTTATLTVVVAKVTVIVREDAISRLKIPFKYLFA